MAATEILMSKIEATLVAKFGKKNESMWDKMLKKYGTP